MRWARRWGIALVLAACSFWAAGAAAPTGSGKPLAEILRDLGSAEFAVRERAQGELAKVPKEQLQALKEAEKGATDEEVKARLEARISEIELEALLHPPKLSVDLKAATLEEVAAALNKQLGAPYIYVAPDIVAPPLTLKAREQPLWDILRQLNEQLLMSFDNTTVRLPTGAAEVITLEPPLPWTLRQKVLVTDGVGIVPQQFSGNPATGNWTLRCRIFADPRVQLTGYQWELQVEKAIDQEGRAIGVNPPSPAMYSSGTGATWSMNCTVTFAPRAGVKAIKELRGSVRVEVLDNQDMRTLDLTKEQKEPLVTVAGTFRLEKAANGDLTVKWEPSAEGAANPPSMRVYGDEGGQSLSTSPGTRSWSIPAGNVPGRAATVEIMVSRKARKAVLPVVLRDVEVPADAEPVRRGR
jgi:hypothetical protein